jgi:hypothetical protein
VSHRRVLGNVADFIGLVRSRWSVLAFESLARRDPLERWRVPRGSGYYNAYFTAWFPSGVRSRQQSSQRLPAEQAMQLANLVLQGAILRGHELFTAAGGCQRTLGHETAPGEQLIWR